MCIGQLTSRLSLRDLVDNVSVQQHRRYHLGGVKLSRSNLARINQGKPFQLHEALFSRLLKKCHSTVLGHGFRFNNDMISLDVTMVDLCLSVFPWAKFRKTKGAVKLHVGMNHRGNLPGFVTITDGKTHDVSAGRKIEFPRGSILAMDRGCTDYKRFEELSDKGI